MLDLIRSALAFRSAFPSLMCALLHPVEGVPSRPVATRSLPVSPYGHDPMAGANHELLQIVSVRDHPRPAMDG